MFNFCSIIFGRDKDRRSLDVYMLAFNRLLKIYAKTCRTTNRVSYFLYFVAVFARDPLFRLI